MLILWFTPCAPAKASLDFKIPTSLECTTALQPAPPRLSPFVTAADLENAIDLIRQLGGSQAPILRYALYMAVHQMSEGALKDILRSSSFRPLHDDPNKIKAAFIPLAVGENRYTEGLGFSGSPWDKSKGLAKTFHVLSREFRKRLQSNSGDPLSRALAEKTLSVLHDTITGNAHDNWLAIFGIPPFAGQSLKNRIEDLDPEETEALHLHLTLALPPLLKMVALTLNYGSYKTPINTTLGQMDFHRLKVGTHLYKFAAIQALRWQVARSVQTNQAKLLGSRLVRFPIPKEIQIPRLNIYPVAKTTESTNVSSLNIADLAQRFASRMEEYTNQPGSQEQIALETKALGDRLLIFYRQEFAKLLMELRTFRIENRFQPLLDDLIGLSQNRLTTSSDERAAWSTAIVLFPQFFSSAATLHESILATTSLFRNFQNHIIYLSNSVNLDPSLATLPPPSMTLLQKSFSNSLSKIVLSLERLAGASGRFKNDLLQVHLNLGVTATREELTEATKILLNLSTQNYLDSGPTNESGQTPMQP